RQEHRTGPARGRPAPSPDHRPTRRGRGEPEVRLRAHLPRFGDAADLVEEPRPAGDGSARGRRRRGGPGRDRQGRPAREQDGLPRRGDQEIHDPARRTHRGQRLSLGQAVGQAPPHQQGLLLRDRGSLRRLSHRRAIRPGISDSSRVRTRAGSVCPARPAPPRRQGCGGARTAPVAAARGRRKLWNDVVSHPPSMEAAATAEDTDHTPSYVATGQEFTRDTNYIDDRILNDADAQWPVDPGRYRLIAARACPWANRTIIVRRLLGLEDVISLGMPGPTHDARSWT